MPSVVENTIQFGKISPDPILGRQRYFDSINKITVIIEDETGTVVTAIPGKRN
jgi:hypothetical protein